MLNLDNITNENNKKNNRKWPIGGSGSGKINTLFNLISHQDYIYKIYLYVKDLSEPKYEFLITRHKDAGIKHLND